MTGYPPRYEYRVKQRVYGSILYFVYTSRQAALNRIQRYSGPGNNVVNLGLQRREVGPWRSFKEDR